MRESGILRHARPGACVVHADGARAYSAVIKPTYPRLKIRSVNHKHMEFVKRVRRVRLPSGRHSAASSGTQAFDSTWKSLDLSIPKEINTKSGHQENPLLEECTYSWLLSINHRNKDGFRVLGGYVAKQMG